MRRSIHLSLLALVLAVRPAHAADLAAAGCPIGGSGETATVSSRIPAACDDAAALQDLIFELGATGTLIVDKLCTLDAGLRLPPRFHLTGTGIGSGGQIAFEHDGIGISLCQEAPQGYVTISDLDLYGPNPPGSVTAPHSTGIALAHQNIVYIRRVRVSDFYTGISGVSSFSVFIQGSNISNNRGDNIVVGYDSNGWRIRDGIVSQAGGWGINVLGPDDARPLGSVNASNDLLIDGVRMESNVLGGVRTDAYGTRVVNSRFEGNGLLRTAPHRAILVDGDAREARILTNELDGDCIQIANTATATRAFNIPESSDTATCP